MVLPLEQPLFITTFERPLDDKGRVQLPAKWRWQADTNDETFLAFVDRGKHLSIYPKAKLDELRERRKVAPHEEKKAIRAFLSRLAAEGTQFGLDSVGRMNIPNAMLERVGIPVGAKGGKLMLVGQEDYFQAWSVEAYEAEQSDREPIDSEAFYDAIDL